MNEIETVNHDDALKTKRGISDSGPELISVLSELRISPNNTVASSPAAAATPSDAAEVSSGDALRVQSEDIRYRPYYDEDDIKTIMDLISPYLSEPYSIYCYRYFLHGWPHLCLLHGDKPVGVIVCKQERHQNKLNRGYIAMLSTKPEYRKHGIASTLVEKAIARMTAHGAQEIVLETEVSNAGALRLYARLGFIREKRLYRFYLNASDAFRLCLPVDSEDQTQDAAQAVESQ